MHRSSTVAWLVVIAITLTLIGCGDSETDAARNAENAASGDDSFCAAMEGVAERMAPDDAKPTPPSALRVDFEEVVTLLDEAQQHAPARISDDVSAFATAIDAYVVALDDADYDLDTIFSTPEGTKVAEDTSHALTPAVIDHMIGPCGITLE